jgi:hypothetical protein
LAGGKRIKSAVSRRTKPRTTKKPVEKRELSAGEVAGPTVATRNCFVISPISKSRRGRHADLVFERIIQPAMRECGFKAYRIDHLAAIGSIPNAIVEQLRQADLCIAVVTGHNPNVMFELGIRQAWDLPVIQMAKAATRKLPFDIQSRYTVFYKLDKSGAVEAIRKVVHVLGQIDLVTRSTPSGAVPRYSQVFSHAMGQLGHRYCLDAVFEAKRTVIDTLLERMQKIQHVLISDYELQQPTAKAKAAAHHRRYIEDELKDLRIKCLTFEIIARAGPVSDACRMSCHIILDAIKSLMTVADQGLRSVFGIRKRRIDMTAFKKLVENLIDVINSLRPFVMNQIRMAAN